MASYHPLSLPPILYHLLPFMPERSIFTLAQCSSDCNTSIRSIKRRELYRLISEDNTRVGNPMSIRSIDQVECASDKETIRINELIQRREKDLSTILPSYVKDFLQICGDFDCRSRWDDYYPHPTNMMLPFEDWEFISNSALTIPPRRWVDHYFEHYNRESLLVIGHLKTMKSSLLVETNTGILYIFRPGKFTKLVNFTNWYKLLPVEIGNELAIRIEQFKKKQNRYSDFKYARKYRYLTVEKKKDPKIVHYIMELGYIESTLPFEYRDNPEFMLKYIRRNVAAFLICSKRLKFDNDFVEKAFDIDFSMFYIRDSRNWNSKYINYDKAKQIIDNFQSRYITGKNPGQTNTKVRHRMDLEVPPPIQGNPVISNFKSALKLVKENGLYLKYCTEELVSNRGIVFPAIQNNGMALSFADLQFREDAEIVKAALSNNPYSIQLISESFFDRNEEIILDFMVKNLSNNTYSELIPTKYTSNFDLMKQSIILNPSNYCHTNFLSNEEVQKLWQDKELLIRCIWNNPNDIPKFMKQLPIESIDSDVMIALMFSNSTSEKYGDFVLRQNLLQFEQTLTYRYCVNNTISTANLNQARLNKLQLHKWWH